MKYVRAIFFLILSGCGNSDLWRSSDFPYAAEFPFVVKLRDPVTDLNCSGTLLSETTVLTAAHCLQRQGRFVVVAASGVVSAHEVARLGKGTPEDTGDIAVLKTDEPIAAASFPKIGRSLQAGERVRLAGFGCTDFETVGGGGAQQVGWNRVDYVGDFAYLLSPIGVRGLVSQGGETAGLCYGDSGSPAFRDSSNVVVGVGHGAGRTESDHVSFFVDLTQPAQRSFLESANSQLGLSVAFEAE